MKKGVKRRFSIIRLILLTIFVFLVLLFFIRLISPSEIDDVSPGIKCPELATYNPDVLYVIPDYNDKPLSFYPEWCSYILSLNKTLALHGVTHTYREFFYSDISQEKLNFGISEFERCFNKTPEMFKPPQLDISKANKQLILNNNLKLKTKKNQIIHKVYHCSDSDIIPNRFINRF
jgi:predicted deacetylase